MKYTNSEIKEFLRDRYPSLNPSNLLSSEQAEDEDLDKLRLRKSRNDDFQSLLDISADTQSPCREIAVSALFRITLDATPFLGPEEPETGALTNPVAPRFRIKEFQVRAAEALVSQIETGATPDSDIAKMVLTGLCLSNVSRVRMEFLKGLHKLMAYGSARRCDIFQMLDRIVKAELNKNEIEQDAEFQAALIDSLVFLGSSTAKPVLQALTASQFATVQQQAQNILALLETKENANFNL